MGDDAWTIMRKLRKENSAGRPTEGTPSLAAFKTTHHGKLCLDDNEETEEREQRRRVISKTTVDPRNLNTTAMWCDMVWRTCKERSKLTCIQPRMQTIVAPRKYYMEEKWLRDLDIKEKRHGQNQSNGNEIFRTAGYTLLDRKRNEEILEQLEVESVEEKKSFNSSTAGYTLLDRKRNEEILEQLEVESVEEKISRYKFNCLDHVRRMENSRIAKTMMQYKPRGHRRLGRPFRRLLDGAETGLQRPNS
ncbi:hypothetical protein ANN_12185 [Periplaneta americana]|uniref:Uncharacterized protein n=1 Tax=Periplaneta americana TaxID=6978 RepID=A0ABQ8TI30_PERAM|nr:hypothetical protein ANN_12185 [Periplaneta americana]